MFTTKEQVSVTDHCEEIWKGTKEDIKLDDSKVVLPTLISDSDMPSLDIYMYFLANILHFFFAYLALETLVTGTSL